MKAPYASSWLAAALLAPSVSAAEFDINGRHFTLPTGFSIELAASPDSTPRPISGAIDDQGRLYVTDSSGSNEAPAKQAERPAHRVLQLTDTNGDGRYDKVVVFADRLMFPEGCLWHGGSVYVAAPPVIWKLTDTNHDGVADLRERWWDGGTLTGCANDLHGPYLGPDGFIYWTKGAFAEQTHDRPGRKPIHDRAAHIYRARPDGSGLETVMTGGMDNPVEVAFTPDGEALFTSTFIDFSQPGRRDGIAYAVYGGVYGKPNRVIEDRAVTRTGPELLPIMHQFGAGAPSGLCRKEGAAWGDSYRDNFFASSFNLHKITRHQVHFEGAGYASVDEDFLACPDVDFHPTDVLEDADGSLLVLDTGGWYRICCPSSQLAKPDVLGAVYRIRKIGAPVERRKAGAPPNHRDGPYWAAKQAGLKRDASAGARLRAELKSVVEAYRPDKAPQARVLCEALGRIGDTAAAPEFLAAATVSPDPFLQHSAIFALIELDSPAAARAGLASDKAAVRRAALIALAEMDHGDLRPAEAAVFLADPADEVASVAQWVLGRRADWSEPLAGWFRAQWLSPALPERQRNALNADAEILANSDQGRGLLADMITDARVPASTRLAALRAVAAASQKKGPDRWAEAVVAALAGPPFADESFLTAAVRAAAVMAADARVGAALHTVARSAVASEGARLGALAALPPGETLEGLEFALLSRRLAPENAGSDRSQAATTLAKARLSAAQRDALLERLVQADPLTLGQLLPAYDQGMDVALCARLVAALKASPAGRSLSPAQLRPHFSKYPDDARALAEAFANSLNESVAAQAAQLAGLLGELKKIPADPRRGQQLFNGPKAACATCHRIGYLGGEVGPELTSIGEARTEQDLLESIVFPSATFARGYEPSVIRLKNGDIINGIVKGETGESVEIVTGPGPSTVVRRSDVAETAPGSVSVMPAGFGEALTRQELADLLNFVKTVRWR